MEQRIVIQHVTGSKANQKEEFPVDSVTELVVGRDPTAQVKYDPERDDLVSRQHLSITKDEKDPTSFTIKDKGSQNGTFLNKQRIAGPMPLTPGDVVQLGPGGPEFIFDLDPRPAGTAKATRIAEYPKAPPTRVTTTSDSKATVKTGVGKETVERMIAQSRGSGSNQMAINIGAAVIGVVVLIIGALVFKGIIPLPFHHSNSASAQPVASVSQGQAPHSTPEASQSMHMTAREISQKYTSATVYVETTWRLIYRPNGKEIFERRAANGKVMYKLYPDGRIEPFMTTRQESNYKSGTVANKILGEHIRGSGFVVSSDGYILTNRHVAAPWEAPVAFDRDGVVIKVNKDGQPLFTQDHKLILGKMTQFQWIPTNSRQLENETVGRLDQLDVKFANSALAVPAHVVRISDQHDVALIKIDTPESVNKVNLYDNYNTVAGGDAVTVLGYPALSPDKREIIQSHGLINQQAQQTLVLSPTVTTGVISKVIRSASNASVVDKLANGQDAYELDVDTGAGNSGGPVFDDQGRVIGIFYADATGSEGARFTYAVPIRYGMDLMRISPSQ